jgi:hypothetical protein
VVGPIRVLQQAEVNGAGGPLQDNLSSPVAGAVVDHQDFRPVGPAGKIILYTKEGLWKAFLFVESGDNHRETDI